MKPLIVGLALIILTMYMLTFQSEMYVDRIEVQKVKFCAENAANSAMLFFNQQDFFNGIKKYNVSSGIKAIEKVISQALVTDLNLKPLDNSYWGEKIEYTAVFFHGDNICQIYENGSLKQEFSYQFPYLYEDEKTGYKKTISEPGIIVTIDCGIPKNTGVIGLKACIRSSAYTE